MTLAAGQDYGISRLSRDVRKTETLRPKGQLGKRFLVFLALVGVAGYLIGGFWRFTDEVDRLSNLPPVGKADGIVVLTGGAMRIEYGLRLLRSGHGRRLLISGVHPGTSAATLARLTETDKAWFDCCVDIDYVAADTIGNAEMAGRWAQKHGYRDLILVTSDYHMPRSLVEFDRIPNIRSVKPVAVRRAGLWNRDSLPTVSGLRLLLTEYGKVLATRIRGVLGMAPQDFEPQSRFASLSER
ncbi:YdcF family protein [Jiella sp. MQZ9-1]|uniref:YdcF family protein n=1 Tax=Jiella flava TaxID=2816857 RepID=A0A939FZY3_9HYPH|nr:YdcF family protein [Jiella flava]MBO0663073.1 YdcF family protein [Jiella flava]MCD2471492.1 YdcF family protein [Jiella flava]